ncbi:LytTR family DNA-binding domain-containing protein [Flavobacterium sp. MC2016-06]|uniref:LytR/AlgR family response regulator transcription factor n=1 Tax=Flavobacterium sp. MC2016-06 TaxID=2676308 RepID=UPI0012BAF2F4|nr:LytTR family DNA-binding domain-containing protein [Flavobacterium sp. MC2016-06]MBU3857642.1 LytTR family DNA-binding domain-containing protein [Flavobacterium sp. MC2016-06]
MKIVIIEDEMLVAEDLASMLMQLKSDIEIVSILSSVAESTAYFSTNKQPDLIFSDIQLGDGISFEIFKAVTINVPVIFCTAFDQYALEAFKANGIEYILKPFNTESLETALAKFESLKMMMNNSSEKNQAAMDALNEAESRLSTSTTVMIKYRDKILPFSFEKIAMFFLEDELIYLYTFTGKSYIISESLEEMEKKTPEIFFRVNRQFLVHKKAIEFVSDYFPRKLKITLNFDFNKDIIVSKEKKGKVLSWLKN